MNSENSNKMNIKDYKFNDHDVADVVTRTYSSGVEIVEVNFCGGNCLHLFKRDAIALAKHFGLSATDLTDNN